MQFIENRFFDSHCHFDFAAFDADRASLWQSCNNRKITRLLMPGVTPGQWPIAAQLCAHYGGLFYAAGIHPHWIERQPWFQLNNESSLNDVVRERIVGLIAHEFIHCPNSDTRHCVAVGECGLDKMISTSFELQQQLLIVHIKIANQLQKPLIIHCVRAHNELITLLKKYKPQWGGVIHAFSGSYEIAQQYTRLGFYLGVGGTITYPRAQKTRAAVTAIPLEFLVLETDAPDMPLSGQQGMRNSPLAIEDVAQTLAELRGLSVKEIAQATWQNSCRLFHCN